MLYQFGALPVPLADRSEAKRLQVAQGRYLADELTRFQRLLAWSSGHGEGWALYAERLMGELGYLDGPAFELGMLSAQAMRAVRVIVDIGMHLELPIPVKCAGAF